MEMAQLNVLRNLQIVLGPAEGYTQCRMFNIEELSQTNPV